MSYQFFCSPVSLSLCLNQSYKIQQFFSCFSSIILLFPNHSVVAYNYKHLNSLIFLRQCTHVRPLSLTFLNYHTLQSKELSLQRQILPQVRQNNNVTTGIYNFFFSNASYSSPSFNNIYRGLDIYLSFLSWGVINANDFKGSGSIILVFFLHFQYR